jgi:predicted DNA-binding WGR domain protein
MLSAYQAWPHLNGSSQSPAALNFSSRGGAFPTMMEAIYGANQDRVPLRKKLTLLTRQGHWPAIESIARTYGWHSPELVAFADAHLPSCVCPVCNKQFCLASKRVKYCSEACRLKAAGERDHHRVRHPSGPSGGLPQQRQAALASHQEYCLRLERHIPEEGTRRFYDLMIIQTLFGKTALIRRWGRIGTDRSQSLTTEHNDGESALTEMDRIVSMCLRRGYELLPFERRPMRVLKPGRIGATPQRPSSPKLAEANFAREALSAAGL